MPILLIQATGRDHPGIIDELALVMNNYDARILDVGQAVIHRTLNLGFLVEIEAGDEKCKGELAETARQLGLDVKTIRAKLKQYSAHDEETAS